MSSLSVTSDQVSPWRPWIHTTYQPVAYYPTGEQQMLPPAKRMRMQCGLSSDPITDSLIISNKDANCIQSAGDPEDFFEIQEDQSVMQSDVIEIFLSDWQHQLPQDDQPLNPVLTSNPPVLLLAQNRITSPSIPCLPSSPSAHLLVQGLLLEVVVDKVINLHATFVTNPSSVVMSLRCI